MKELLSVIKEVEKDFKSSKEKLNSYLEIGSSYFLGKEYKKAINTFEKAIGLDSKNAGGWLGKAMSQLAQAESTEINSLEIGEYIQRAQENCDLEKFSKYLTAITLYYSYQYAAAIKFYIEQSNQAEVDKQEARKDAVVGMLVASVGGAIANNSKSASNRFIGYGMLAGGGGYAIKNGYDSFNLGKLASSLYGNAMAQTILSIPIIKQCHKIKLISSDDVHQNSNAILDAWRESVIYLFKNEKLNLIKSLETLHDTDTLLDSSKRMAVLLELDEFIYFMDCIGLDESANMTKTRDIKKVLSEMKFADEIVNKRSKAKAGCIIFPIVIFLILAFIIGSFIDDYGVMSDVLDSVAKILLICFIVWLILFSLHSINKLKTLNQSLGLDLIQSEINTLINEFKAITINKSEIDLEKIGV
jgi:hypothetical protein